MCTSPSKIMHNARPTLPHPTARLLHSHPLYVCRVSFILRFILFYFSFFLMSPQDFVNNLVLNEPSYN